MRTPDRTCYDWACMHHLEAKHEALDLTRHGDDDVNAAKLHLEQHQLWEEELRQCREKGISSPTESEDESETEEQGITSTDEKEYSDNEETAPVPNVRS